MKNQAVCMQDRFRGIESHMATVFIYKPNYYQTALVSFTNDTVNKNYNNIFAVCKCG